MRSHSHHNRSLCSALSRSFTTVSLAGLALGISACESNQYRSPSKSYAMVQSEQVQVPNIRMGDTKTINAIIDEGKNESEVMEILHAFTEDYGPRLTGSTNLYNSQEWARAQLDSWGLSNARLEEFDTIATRFDRGPSSGKVFMPATEGDEERVEMRELEFSTLSWSRGTDGPVSGHVMTMPTSMLEFNANRESYNGAWILINPDYAGESGIRSTGFMMRDRMDQRHELRNQEPLEATAHNAMSGIEWKGTFDYNGSMIPASLVINESGSEITGTMSLEGFAEGPITQATRDGDNLSFRWSHSMGTSNINLSFDGQSASGKSVAASGNEYAMEFLRSDSTEITEAAVVAHDELNVLSAVLNANPAGFVSSSKDERVWTTSANEWKTREVSEYPTDIEINIRQSDFDFITARIAQGIDIEVEFDLDHTLTAGPIPMYNLIAEIPGTEFPDELIIISAHIDSWDGPGSKGAVDNATGSAVVTEAARILMATGAKPKRTIQIALWSGEEQGLLGSKAYVEALSENELSKISAAFVDDGGTNYQGGIPAADFMVDYLSAASAPTNGKFFSQTDYDAAMHDDDPDNDAMAGYLNVNIRPTGDRIRTHSGSDHASFNRKGVPGFFWDETGRANYRHAWHTQNDTYDQAIEEYLIQSATNMAIVAFNLANAPELLARDGEVFTDTATIEANLEPVGSIHDHSHD
ncbi:MAG: M28 family metallopeptidase [Phycisphaerales bacterium]